MTDPKMPEETAGGPLGKLAGKAKEVAGSILGNEQLAREGRLQQAQAEAEAEAGQAEVEARQREAETEVEAAKMDNVLERERLQAELAAKEREAAIDRDERSAFGRRRCVPSRRRRPQNVSAGFRSRPRPAPSDKQRPSGWQQEQTAIRLEQEARRTEARANAIDPEETR